MVTVWVPPAYIGYLMQARFLVAGFTTTGLGASPSTYTGASSKGLGSAIEPPDPGGPAHAALHPLLPLGVPHVVHRLGLVPELPVDDTDVHGLEEVEDVVVQVVVVDLVTREVDEPDQRTFAEGLGDGREQLWAGS